MSKNSKQNKNVGKNNKPKAKAKGRLVGASAKNKPAINYAYIEATIHSTHRRAGFLCYAHNFVEDRLNTINNGVKRIESSLRRLERKVDSLTADRESNTRRVVRVRTRTSTGTPVRAYSAGQRSICRHFESIVDLSAACLKSQRCRNKLMNALQMAGITSVGRLTLLTWRQVMALPGIGVRACDSLREALRLHGYALRDEVYLDMVLKGRKKVRLVK